jgi:hypothetical protein
VRKEGALIRDQPMSCMNMENIKCFVDCGELKSALLKENFPLATFMNIISAVVIFSFK